MTEAQKFELARKEDALSSARRLVRTGNNRSFWRKREAELETQIAALRARATQPDTSA